MRATTALAVALALVAGLAACEDEAPRRPRGAPPPGASGLLASARRPLPDGGPAGDPADPVPQSGDLKTEVERFTTVDACVAQHARLDPLVGDALRAVGYGTFVRDTCRSLEALKTKDREKCAAISASTLRTHCIATLAMAMANADMCPLELSQEPESGRIPRCVAVALRDPRLCLSESTAAARGVCEAIATRDVSKCAGAGEEKDECARQVDRMKGYIEPRDGKLVPLPSPEAKLVIKGDAGPGVPRDMTSEVRRGVVLVTEHGGKSSFVVGRLGLHPGSSLIPGPGHTPRVGAKLIVGDRADVERLELELPLRPALVVPGASRAELKGQVTAPEPKRGSVVTFEIEGRVDDVEIRVTGTTFIRDVTSPTR